MMFNEIKSGEIPCLSFLKGTDYAMYVGPELTPKQRELLKSKDIPVPVIYLPEILEQLSEAVVKYNFPGVTLPESLTVESIYAQIRAEFDGRITPESRLIIKYNGDVLAIYDAKDCFSLVVSYLINMCAPKPSKRRMLEKIYWSRSEASLDDLFDALDEEKDDVRFSIRPCREEDADICYSIQEKTLISEEGFDDEMQKAFHEAEDIIKTLLLKGCPPELLLTLINQSVKLSRIRISKQFKIYLTDYDNEEIKMGPLPKTVFLFYLRHPEGVMFSHLQNYRDELLRIYGHVCTNDDPQRMEDSIDRLINPFDNSICEKCANVKKAFILKIADNIASNYYISGEQGEKKSIPLDRNLVEWECEL
jgi:hypothetical protein